MSDHVSDLVRHLKIVRVLFVTYNLGVERETHQMARYARLHRGKISVFGISDLLGQRPQRL